MAKQVVKAFAIKVASQDLSDHLAEGAVLYTAADVNVTAMGQGAVNRLQGIQDYSFTAVFWNDLAANSVNATLDAAWATNVAGSTFLVEMWPSGTVTSATNPKYSGSCILTEYQPMQGAVGDGMQTAVTFPVDGTIARATA